jgi:hypothetical protein
MSAMKGPISPLLPAAIVTLLFGIDEVPHSVTTVRQPKPRAIPLFGSDTNSRPVPVPKFSVDHCATPAVAAAGNTTPFSSFAPVAIKLPISSAFVSSGESWYFCCQSTPPDVITTKNFWGVSE